MNLPISLPTFVLWFENSLLLIFFSIFEISVTMSTTGDKILDTELSKVSAVQGFYFLKWESKNQDTVDYLSTLCEVKQIWKSYTPLVKKI